MKIIAGSSNISFAKSLAGALNSTLSEVEISRFANGEKRVWIKDTVKGENVVLVQTFGTPTDENIIEFLLLADALERLGARHVNAVIPWFGYSLQDKVFRVGEPIAAKVVANLVSNAYIKRAFLLDLHNSSTPGFFSIPVQHLSTQDVFSKYVHDHFDVTQCVVASPDFGGLKRARVFAEKLGVELVNIDKHRDLVSGQVTALGIHGNVDNKIVILVDDVINTGGTVISAADILKQHGAREVHFLSSHGPLVPEALHKLQDSSVDSIVVTNSIESDQTIPKLHKVDVAPLFAQEISTWQNRQ